MHAYVDESHYAGPPSFYLLAAVLVDEESIDRAREAVRALQVHKRRVHWHREEPAGRVRLASAVAAIGLPATVVIGTPVRPEKQERARRHCLGQLVWILGGCGVTTVCLESRGALRDVNDRLALAGFRGSGVLDPSLYVNHAVADAEPLLWAADIVAGAASEAERGESRYLAALAEAVLLHRFPLK